MLVCRNDLRHEPVHRDGKVNASSRTKAELAQRVSSSFLFIACIHSCAAAARAQFERITIRSGFTLGTECASAWGYNRGSQDSWRISTRSAGRLHRIGDAWTNL